MLVWQQLACVDKRSWRPTAFRNYEHISANGNNTFIIMNLYLFRKSKACCGHAAKRALESFGQTLYKICISKVEELIYHACRNIERIYGNYDEEKCRQKVEELQKYILANLATIVFDDLCEIREVRLLRQTQDIRIELALYMHRNMRKFFITRFIKVPTKSFNSKFWAMQSAKLQNLVVLDLNLSCTDDILEIVAENCQKLAYIDVVSRVEAMEVQEWRRTCFNALKLRYCVSDVGLGYLCKCKLLRKISMNRRFRSHFGGGLVTLGGIRRLVKSLPLLQDITFEDMGMVLADEMDDVRHLSLTCITDFHPQPAHFDVVSRLCPDLKQLCLRFSRTSNTSSEVDVLHALALSGLKVCELQLIGFLYSSELNLVIETKGCYLHTLAMENIGSITSETIEVIGRACPDLMNLYLSEEVYPAGEVFQFNSQFFDVYPAGGMFGKLQYLTLTGKNWIPNDVLPLCLTSAKGLRVLKIYNTNSQGSYDAAITRVISTNSLQELRTVHLWVHSRLTIGTLQYFFRNCPKLTELLFLKTANLTQEHIDLLCAEMEKQKFYMFTK